MKTMELSNLEIILIVLAGLWYVNRCTKQPLTLGTAFDRFLMGGLVGLAIFVALVGYGLSLKP